MRTCSLDVANVLPPSLDVNRDKRRRSRFALVGSSGLIASYVTYMTGVVGNCGSSAMLLTPASKCGGGFMRVLVERSSTTSAWLALVTSNDLIFPLCSTTSAR